jgi:hypothetical protein
MFLFAGVLSDIDAADDEEAVAAVKLVRQAPELRMQGWQWECLCADVTE